MAASLIVGLPRHGKSLFGVMQAKAELLDGKRYLVTNLPFDLPKLGTYLEECFDVTCEPQLWDRVRLLTPEETSEFWLYDPEGEINDGVPLIEVSKRPWRQKSLKEREAIQVPNFAHRQRPEYPGVLYIIDEAHLFFDAHHWQQIGNDLSYFVSQHAHMRTDIMLITQHPAKLAKRLKLDLEEWTEVENLGRRRGYMGVTLPGWFRRATYPGKPDDPEQGEPEVGRFKLDQKLADCYSTSAGVGLSGRVDTQEKTKGKHWSRWAVSAAALLVACCVLPYFVLTGLGKLTQRGLRAALGVGGSAAGALATTNGVFAPTNRPVLGVANENLHPNDRFPQPYGIGPSALDKTERTKWGVPTRVDDSAAELVGMTHEALLLADGEILYWRDGWRWRAVPQGAIVQGAYGFIPWRKARGSRVSSDVAVVVPEFTGQRTGPGFGGPRGVPSVGVRSF